MSSKRPSLSVFPPSPRKFAFAGLISAALLATPHVSLAQANAPSAAATPGAADAADTKVETVEARIAKLHSELMISPKDESKWNNVAKTMRDNAAAMQILVAKKSARSAESTTAVDDLLTYQEFAKAHLAGLTTLTAAFKALYDSMTPAQKKNADKVFETFGRQPADPQG